MAFLPPEDPENLLIKQQAEIADLRARLATAEALLVAICHLDPGGAPESRSRQAKRAASVQERSCVLSQWPSMRS
jgi:hypothetical protein